VVYPDDPSLQIVRLVELGGVDLTAMARLGRTLLSPELMDSVREKVVR
jgi:hypothetical protein